MNKITSGKHPALSMPFEDLYKGLMAEVEAGYINVQTKDGLELFNYTMEATFEKHWNVFTLISRGLILHPATQRIVALPFPKFFNYGEVEESLPNLGFTTSTKMDGSLGILYHWMGKWHVATRGSFESDQAVWAEAKLKDYYTYFLDRDITYLAEIIYPQNRIVVSYGYEDLVLLGGYNRYDGWEINRSYLLEASRTTGMGITDLAHFDSLDDILTLAKELPHDQEGFVIRFDNGYRIKIKGDEYCRLHRLVSNCTPLVIWDMMRNLDNLELAKKDLPEEFKRDFEKIESILTEQLEKVLAGVEEAYKSTLDMEDKELGLFLQSPDNHLDPKVKRFIFPCRKGNFLEVVRTRSKTRDRAFELFRPTGNVLEGFEPSTAMNRFEENK